MMARSTQRFNQRPDTLMHDRTSANSTNSLAPHGRTIHWVTSRHSVMTRPGPLYPQKRTNGQMCRYVCFVLRAQPVDATQALNFSAGVSNPRVLRGRSLSWRATLLRWACEYTDKSAPFGKYCLSRPLVFSLEPRCHGLCGSQK